MRSLQLSRSFVGFGLGLAAVLTVLILLQMQPWLAPSIPTGWRARNADISALFVSTDSTEPELQQNQPASRQPMATAPAAVGKKLNLNTAAAHQLEKLPGIGPAKAQAIIEYRAKNGSFQSVEDILKVKGIGPKLYEAIKSQVVLKE